MGEFEDIEISGKVVDVPVTVNIKDGKLLRIMSGFRPRIQPQKKLESTGFFSLF